MKKIYITNINALLELMNIEIKRELPDPSSYDPPFYRLATITQRLSADFVNEKDFTAELNNVEFTNYVKGKLGYEGNHITVWVEE